MSDSKGPSLYRLTDAASELLDMAIDGDLDEGEKEQADLLLAEVLAECGAKIDATIYFRRRLRSEASLLKDEEKRLAKRRKALENLDDRLGLGIHAHMVAIGERTLKTEWHSLRLQESSSAEVLDFDEIPDTLKIKQEPKLDGRELLRRLRSGEEIPGAVLRKKDSLRVR